jgi:hypothetical protein
VYVGRVLCGVNFRAASILFVVIINSWFRSASDDVLISNDVTFALTKNELRNELSFSWQKAAIFTTQERHDIDKSCKGFTLSTCPNMSLIAINRFATLVLILETEEEFPCL